MRMPPVDRRSPSDSRSTRIRSLSIFTGSLSTRDEANVFGAGSAGTGASAAGSSVTLRRYRPTVSGLQAQFDGFVGRAVAQQVVEEVAQVAGAEVAGLR